MQYIALVMGCSFVRVLHVICDIYGLAPIVLGRLEQWGQYMDSQVPQPPNI